MQNRTPEASDLKTEFKDLVLRLRQEAKLPQKYMAFVGDVDPSQISRWENPQLDMHPPIYLIAACLVSQDEKTIAIGLELLDRLEQLAGRTAQGNSAKADGQVTDEFRDAAIMEGRFGEVIADTSLSMEEKLVQLEKIQKGFQNVAQRMAAEVKQIREKNRLQKNL